MRFLLCAMLLIASCSGEKEVVVNPQPKSLEVGENADFVLNAAESSQFVTSGKMNVRLDSIDDREATFIAKVNLETKFGPQNVEITQAVGQEILSLDFLVELRSNVEYVGEGYKIRYLSISREGCDVVRIYEMEKYKGVVLEATLCVSSQKVPSLKVQVDMYGVPVNLVFVQAS